MDAPKEELHELTLSCRKLASKIALEWARKTRDCPDECLGDAMLALVKAALAYDRSRGCAFTTLAGRYVLNAMRFRFRARLREQARGRVSLDDYEPVARLDRGCPLDAPAARALASLHCIDRDILVGCYRGKLKFGLLAWIAGVPLAGVRERLQVAARRLKKRLKKEAPVVD